MSWRQGWATGVALIVWGLGAAGCAGPPQVSDTDVAQVTTEQLRDMLAQAKDPTVLVDVRTPAKFAESHIPGAINIFLPQLRQAEPRLAEARHIVTCSGGYNDRLSTIAAKNLLGLGYRNVYDYPGGVERWVREGNRAEGSAPAAK